MTKPIEEEKIVVDLDGNIKEAIEQLFEDWVDFFRVSGTRHFFEFPYSVPAIALANSLAEKGSRSATCSPTPMK